MTTRQDLRREIEETRQSFHDLMARVPEDAYPLPSGNPAWTVAEVLYHISLAPRFLFADIKMIVSQRGYYRLIPMLVPRGLFNWLNVIVTRYGAKRATPQSLALAYDRGHASTLQALDSISEDDMKKRAQYPDWDPMLAGEITLEDLFRYIRRHFEAHEAQINTALDQN